MTDTTRHPGEQKQEEQSSSRRPNDRSDAETSSTHESQGRPGQETWRDRLLYVSAAVSVTVLLLGSVLLRCWTQILNQRDELRIASTREAVQSGFFDLAPIQLDGNHVSPLLFAAALLDGQQQFHFAKDEQDLTLIRVDARGVKDGTEKRVVYQVIDRRDLETGFTSMQRTVGFTMALGARLILTGQLNQPGLISATDVPYDLVVPGLFL